MNNEKQIRTDEQCLDVIQSAIAHADQTEAIAKKALADLKTQQERIRLIADSALDKHQLL